MSITVRCSYLSSGKPIPSEITVSDGMTIPDIIRELVRVYGMDPYDIVNGLCDYFASDLIEALEATGKEADLDWTPEDVDLPEHCWVEVDRRFYDAETPLGAPHWRELRIFKNSCP